MTKTVSGYSFTLKGFLPSGRSAKEMSASAQTLLDLAEHAKSLGMTHIELKDMFNAKRQLDQLDQLDIEDITSKAAE